MEELLALYAGGVALVVETVAVLLVAIGAAEAIVRLFGKGRRPTLGEQRMAWLHFARWLVLALEFELGADIIRTAIAPSWDEVGQLAAIAVVRTFLNYFLEEDMQKLMARAEAS